MYWFVGIVLSIYLLINGYMFARLYMTLAGMGFLRLLFCLLFLLFSLSFPLSRILDGRLPQALTNLLMAMAAIYIAPMIYGFIFTILADVLRLLNNIVRLTPNPPPFSAAGRFSTVMIVILLSVAVSLGGFFNAAKPIVVRKSLDWNYPLSLKIAVASDIHFGRLVGVNHLGRIVELINAESPDIVILPGDIADDYEWLADDATKREAAEIFSRLKPRLGVWASLGNHEYYAGEISLWKDFLASAGVNLLKDEWAFPGGEVIIVGRDDLTVTRLNGVRRELKGLIADAFIFSDADRNAVPVIVVDHQPFNLGEAADSGVALQISGHTHRGQLFPINFIVSAIYEKHYGLYKKGDTHYYISSGAGTWGTPIRTVGRPEVVSITLNEAKRTGGLLR